MYGRGSSSGNGQQKWAEIEISARQKKNHHHHLEEGGKFAEMAQTRSRSRGPRSTSESQSGGAGGQENIYFFIPNLIGFTRVILGFGAFWTAPDDPTTTFWLYFWSCFMDALDGHAARYFGQSECGGGDGESCRGCAVHEVEARTRCCKG